MNIFVSNLSFSVQDEDLNELFSEFGSVESAKVITDRENGRSRGFGFVEMTDEEGQAAIDALNGKEFEGREMNVAVAKPRTEGGSRGGFNRGGGFGGGYGGGRR
ncbi:MAG: RNA-binding protein [Bacteroidaceae bacterium]